MAFLAPKVAMRIQKDIADVQKNKIEDISLLEIQDLREVSAVIQGPQGTPFEGGSFIVKLTFSEEFPAKPPHGVFVTKIFHPNVAPKTGEICVNTLKKDWQSTLGLRHVLMVIRCLMIEPNPDSALNADAGRLIQENFSAYEERAKLFTEIHAKSQAKTKKMEVSSPAKPKQEKTIEEGSEENELKENDRSSVNKVASSSASVAKPVLTTKKPVAASTTVKKSSTLKRL